MGPGNTKTLCVLDGTAALYRSWFGVPSRLAPDGTEIGALQGLAQWVCRGLKVLQPTYVAVVFDHGGKTFRHTLDPAYKAGREEPSPELEAQRVRAPSMCRALGVPAFVSPGFEADDLMAAFAKRGRAAGVSVDLVTPDKDALQLLGPGVRVREPKEWGPITAADVQAQFGVPPSALVDWLALAGDPTDHVPGVRGVGPKAATALIAAFGSLEGIYADLTAVSRLPVRGAASLQARLAEGREVAEHCRALVCLRQDAPLDPPVTRLGDLRWEMLTPDRQQAFSREYGFLPPAR